MGWFSIVLLFYAGVLCFVDQRLPASWVERWVQSRLPESLKFELDSCSVGFHRGIRLCGIRVFDRAAADPSRVMASAEEVQLYPFARQLKVVALRYPRLPDSYYAPGNRERNSRLEVELPDLGEYAVSLERPEVLDLRPRRVDAKVTVSPGCVAVDYMHLEWPLASAKNSVDGSCRLDLAEQTLVGEARGWANQELMRPFVVALDIPVALPYFDAFTDVPGQVPAQCAWKVNLVNCDFRLDLDVQPQLGRYNGVDLASAEGRISLDIFTRGTNLNYRNVIGPFHACDARGRHLDGRIAIDGTNGYNRVVVDAKSNLPLADLFRIGGVSGDLVGDTVSGDAQCRLEFEFPRAMTNNYELLNGRGSVAVENGHLMRMKGFQGLLEAMPAIAPGVSWFTDTTRASGSYAIENGVVKSDDFYLEGSLFSIKMYGRFDTVRDDLDYTARVQFTKKDSLAGRILHPLTWPFTKLLLEFRLTGALAEPQWTYLSVIHRILEVAE